MTLKARGSSGSSVANVRPGVVTRGMATRFALFVLIASIGLDRVASASIMLALELPDLVKQADHIAVVEVKSVRSDWDEKHERIYSTIELAVVDSWKASAAGAEVQKPAALTIVQPGGTVGDVSMVVMGMSRFVPGTRSLVFLRGGVTRAQVVGMSQGMHPMTYEAAAKRWTVTPASLSHVKLVRPKSTVLPSHTQAPLRSELKVAESRLNVREPVALDEMKAEVLRLMSVGQ